jgi:amino acid adenylation domain-containing protein
MTARTTLELLTHLRSLDVKLWADGQQLRYDAPPGALVPALKAELIQHKTEILRFLREAETVVQAGPASISPQPRDGALPLSFAQQRLWFLDQLMPGVPAYNIPTAVRLIGPLNAAVLEQSLREIIRRHEALRTTFPTREGQPVQAIRAASDLKFRLSILDVTPGPTSDGQIQEHLHAAARQPFDLAQGPLIRASLLRVSPTEHILLLVIHHIVFDGWSEEVFFRELTALYQAFSQGQPAPLPALPIQYVDFTLWQQQWLTGDVLADLLACWRQQLGGSLPLLNLPTDQPRPPQQTFRGSHYALPLPRSLTEALRALNRQEGVTMFMTLLAAFQVLLYRYTGQTDLLVGSPIANRSRTEIEDLIGFFINTLVLRTDLSGDPTFRELLRRVRQVALGAYAHQDLPFEQVVEALQPERDLSYQPLFQVMFALQTTPLENLQLPGLTASRVELESGVSLFDLSLDIVEEAGQNLTQLWEYNLDLFDAATIRRMAGHYQTLLAGIVANSDRPISALPLLSAAEHRQFVIDWNDTGAAYPTEQCIHHLFEAQVRRTPEAVAVTFAGRPLTYRELNHRANQLAHHLQTLGVGPETLVGIYTERSLEMIVAVLGVLKAGGAYVPLDTASPKDRLAFMCQDADMPVLLSQQKLASTLPVSSGKTIYLDGDWPIIAQHSGENLTGCVTAGNLAYTIYTSGSTGRSKGVMIEHRSLVNAYLAWEDAYQLRSDATCHLQMANFSFDVFTGDWVRALCSGGKLVLCPREILLAPDRLYALMREQGANCAEFVPAVIRNLIQYLQSTGQSLDFMRVLAVGSDSWYIGEYQEIRQFCGPETRLINSYGLTEATIDSSYFENVSAGLPADRLVPIGRPFANTRLYILDKRLQPVPIGVSGELYVGGAGLARGYLKRPRLTAERFIPHPFSPEAGACLYKTGDLARYLPDGAIELLGRIDYQVKVRGFRIELGEIETWLDRHPAVDKALAVVREDALAQGGNGLGTAKRLIAYFVPTPEQTATGSELRRFLKEKLPDYMIPSAFVRLDSLPLLPNGKINRRALPAPDPARPDEGTPQVAPRDPLELELTQIWQEILGVSSIGVTDNFFDLGGHSLLAVRLMAQLRQRFGQDLPLAILFQGATIEHLAGVLRREKEAPPYSALVNIWAGGSLRPFFCVHPVGGGVLCYASLARHLGSERPFYGLQARGLNGEETPFSRFEEMAAHYLTALRAVQPHGPYLLGGWSLGGVIAFEMAQQLYRQGDRVALLALIDSWAPLAAHKTDDDEAVLLTEFLKDLSSSRVNTNNGSSDLPIVPDDLRQLEPDRRLNYALVQAQKLGLVSPDIGPGQFGQFFQVFKANMRAELNYPPWLYPGRITLFTSREAAAAPDPTLGWSQLSSEPVTVYKMAGDHYTILAEPNVQDLAERLRTSFDQVLDLPAKYFDCLTRKAS